MRSSNDSSMQGKTIFITGAGSGFGAACAHAAYAAGANLVLIDASIAGLAVTSRNFSKSQVLNITAKVTDLTDMKKAGQLALERFGAIDVVFANIGVHTEKPSGRSALSQGQFHENTDFNLLGIWNTVRACLPYVKASCGHIQITSSSYGFETGLSNAPHKIPGIAIELFNRELRKELDGTGATAAVLYSGNYSNQSSPPSGGIDNAQIASDLLSLAYQGVITSPAAADSGIRSVLDDIQTCGAKAVANQRSIPISIYSGCRNLMASRNPNNSKASQVVMNSMDTLYA